MNDPREKNLPKWAQDQMNYLRERILILTSPENPHVKELAILRPKCTELENRLNAMDEIMNYLIRGGHPDAEMIHKLVGGYGMNIVENIDSK